MAVSEDRHIDRKSAAGVFDLVAGTDFSETTAGNAIAGNDVTGLAFLFVGDPENAPESLGAVIDKGGEIGLIGGYGLAGGIANPLIIGGNSPNHLQLLFPQVGRPPQALLRNSNLTKALKLAKAAAELKAAIDLGLAGALALDCALGVIQMDGLR